jgi:hypothetical protein
MFDKEKAQKLSRILAGYVPVRVNGITYTIYDYTFIQEYAADLHQQSVKDDVGYGEYFSDDVRQEILKSKNLWSDKLQKELDGLVAHQSVIRKEINAAEFQSNKRSRLLTTLKANEARVNYLEDRRNLLAGHTIENFARIERYKHLLYQNVYYNGKKLWNTWEEFDAAEIGLITSLLNQAYFVPLIDTKDIRYVARNEPWRSLWKASNGRDSLFGKPAIEYTILQRDLVYWSLVYDNVFENPDCPEEKVIHDDDLLDAWFTEQTDKRKNRGKAGDKVGNSKIANAQNVGIFVDTPEDAEKVYNLNDAAARQAIAKKESVIAKKGRIEEQNLPDSQQEIRMQMNKMAAKARGK